MWGAVSSQTPVLLGLGWAWMLETWQSSWWKRRDRGASSCLRGMQELHTSEKLFLTYLAELSV